VPFPITATGLPVSNELAEITVILSIPASST
jgi:hypothetical protein